MLTDNYGRRFQYLRLSVTDVCNYSCDYCLPDGYQCHGDKKIPLSVAEIRNLLKGFAAQGTEKVRLTGGEPSIRNDLTQIIEVAANTQGINTVALTTNGYKLEEKIKDWHQAGLTSLNVSIDSLDPRLFKSITGHDRLSQIMKGIDIALELGLKVKINAVLLKGINSQQLPLFLDWVKNKPVALRFIELMQTGDNLTYFKKHHIAGDTIRQWLLKKGWELQPREKTAGPADEYASDHHLGRIGLITPYSKDFCASCNRLRISSEGNLHLCLFAEEGYSVRDLLGSESQHQQLVERLQSLLTTKEATHYLENGFTGATYNLSMLGG